MIKYAAETVPIRAGREAQYVISCVRKEKKGVSLRICVPVRNT